MRVNTGGNKANPPGRTSMIARSQLMAVATPANAAQVQAVRRYCREDCSTSSTPASMQPPAEQKVNSGYISAPAVHQPVTQGRRPHQPAPKAAGGPRPPAQDPYAGSG